MAVAEPVVAPKESFAALLDESMGVANSLEGTVVKGRVISIENDAALIDVGLKSEARVPLKDFSVGGSEPEIHVGDVVEVFLERMEDKNGEASLSREKARREEAWTLLEKNFQSNERVTGTIYGRVKGGFTVDLNGAGAFLPGSQVDIRPRRARSWWLRSRRVRSSRASSRTSPITARSSISAASTACCTSPTSRGAA